MNANEPRWSWPSEREAERDNGSADHVAVAAEAASLEWQINLAGLAFSSASKWL